MTTKNFVVKTGLDIGNLTNVQDYIRRHDSDIAKIYVDYVAADQYLQDQIDALNLSADSDVIDIKALRRDADSDTVHIQGLSTLAQEQADVITAILAMLDSDGTNLQALRTDLEAEIAATNADVDALNARLDSDETKLQSLQTQIDDIVGDDLVRIRARLDSDSAVLQTLRTELDAGTTDLENDIAALQDRAAELEARADSDELALQNLDTRLRAEIAATNTDVNNLISDINTNGNDISSLQTFTGEGTTLNTSANNLADAVNEIVSDIADLTGDYLSLANGGTVTGNTAFEGSLSTTEGLNAVDASGTVVSTFADSALNVIVTTTSTANRVLANVPAGSGTFMIQAKSNGQTHFTQVSFARNGTAVFYNEHGEIYTSNSLFAVADLAFSGGNIAITVTPASAASTVFKVTGITISY